MMEVLTPEVIKLIIASNMRRCEAARNAGGILCREAVEGAKIPEGWRLDFATEYFIPPNVELF